MAAVPVFPHLGPESGAVVVFGVGPNLEQPAVLEMVERCRGHGVDPLLLDASLDPWFAEHLQDPRSHQHFPLLCVRGVLVGGLEDVRRLDAQQRLRSLVSDPTTDRVPRIAVSRAAADRLLEALEQPEQNIRILITTEFEHDLAVDVLAPGDLKLVVGEVPVLLDPESASRADGLAIDLVETENGQAFRIDNPNCPNPVRIVDRAWVEGEGRLLDLLVVDVRTPAEYAAGHIDRARLLDATLIDALEQLDRNTALLFCCNGGTRSRKAAERYREAGFSTVYCLQGP